jgi:hypothetical protein
MKNIFFLRISATMAIGSWNRVFQQKSAKTCLCLKVHGFFADTSCAVSAAMAIKRFVEWY